MNPTDDNPVAWQNRYRSRSGPSEEWSEWSEWRDGKQPELQTKAEDGGCYDTEERPLYTAGGQARTAYDLAQQVKELTRRLEALQQEVSK